MNYGINKLKERKMKLDGDKLLAELSRIEGLRLKQLDMDIENCQYESISNR